MKEEAKVVHKILETEHGLMVVDRNIEVIEWLRRGFVKESCSETGPSCKMAGSQFLGSMKIRKNRDCLAPIFSVSLATN